MDVISSTSTRSNLGPLTTPFTYPSSCGIAVLSCKTCSTAWQAQACSTNGGNKQGVQDNPDCWPSQANTYLTGNAFNGGGFYSPAVSCPVGYSAACSATYEVSSVGHSFQFPLVSAETGVGCCPSGFSCGYTWDRMESAQTCFSVYSTGSFPVVHCSSGTSNGFSYMNVPATASASKSDSVVESITVNAPLFQMVYQNTDLPTSTTSTLQSTTSATTSGAATSSTESPESSSASSLSGGAKAGIGVGAAVGGILLIGAAILLWRRKRNGSMLGGPGRSSKEARAELPEDYGGPIYSKPPRELLGSPPASELEGTSAPSELH